MLECLNQKNPVLNWCSPISQKKHPHLLRHSVKKPEMELSEKVAYFRKKKKSLKLQKEEIFLTLIIAVISTTYQRNAEHRCYKTVCDTVYVCAFLCVCLKKLWKLYFNVAVLPNILICRNLENKQIVK